MSAPLPRRSEAFFKQNGHFDRRGMTQGVRASGGALCPKLSRMRGMETTRLEALARPHLHLHRCERQTCLSGVRNARDQRFVECLRIGHLWGVAKIGKFNKLGAWDSLRSCLA